MQLSVIIPTHNPHPGRLHRTLSGLRDQILPAGGWETVLVNNASTDFPDAGFFADCAPANFSIVDEPQPGLTAARRRGFAEACGETCVLVDDDNVLARDYLAEALRLFGAHAPVGAMGGKSAPEFTVEPPAWTHQFQDLLALRNFGDRPLISNGLRPADSLHNRYPAFSPIGAGMVLRRAAIQGWLKAAAAPLPDRRGSELSSSGDNDLVFSVLEAGWEVAYFPSLCLVHLIPAARLEADYLARLNRGIQKSWMQVLLLHDACPWPALSPTGVALRKGKAWFAHHPWTSSAARVRYHGACGHFEGRLRR
jgi:glycosyltransferase involved in cell wall biosynthesis